MTTRREFVLQSAAAGVYLEGCSAIARDALALGAEASRTGPARAPIQRVIPRNGSLWRGGTSGAISGATWAADDQQYVAISDCFGLIKPQRMFHNRTFRMSGNPNNPTFEDLATFPDMLGPVPDNPLGEAGYWASGCLAVDGVLYQYLSTPNAGYVNPDMTFSADFREIGVKLIYSPDSGRTWHNQDGSTPVVWEKWAERSRENMLFFDEKPDVAFSGGFNPLGLLQMGKDYELNRDGYVYGYGMNGADRPGGNQLVCFRVSKSHVLDRRSYEFFAGIRSDGTANWTKDISARAVLHTFPDGPTPNWKLPGQMRTASWSVAAFYIEALRLFMFAGLRWGIDSEGRWFTKPSYLGLWAATSPWGPFTQVHEDASWTPGNDPEARITTVVVPPKWIAADGRSFWLAWGDYEFKGDNGNWNPDASLVPQLKGIAEKPEGAQLAMAWEKKHFPNAKVNMQRFDIVL